MRAEHGLPDTLAAEVDGVALEGQRLLEGRT
jgi:hypothetical protein